MNCLLETMRNEKRGVDVVDVVVVVVVVVVVDIQKHCVVTIHRAIHELTLVPDGQVKRLGWSSCPVHTSNYLRRSQLPCRQRVHSRARASGHSGASIRIFR